jgi:hypothetical protein
MGLVILLHNVGSDHFAAFAMVDSDYHPFVI